MMCTKQSLQSNVMIIYVSLTQVNIIFEILNITLNINSINELVIFHSIRDYKFPKSQKFKVNIIFVSFDNNKKNY